MSRLAGCIAGVAISATMMSAGTAGAQDYAPGSVNTVVRNIPINFSETDYGKLVDIMFRSCNTGEHTVMFNGPYRRVANYARTDGNGNKKNSLGSPVESAGDARYDYVVYRLLGVEGNGPKYVEVDAADVMLQLGIDLNKNASGGSSVPNPVLSATVTLNTNVNANGDSAITVIDTSRPSQILDAGRDIAAGIEVGGVDAMMVIKNGTPKTADLICDMNAWFLTKTPPTDPNDYQYGFKNFIISNNTANSVILFWAAGPSGMESRANIDIVDKIYNPVGTTPNRDKEGVYTGPAPQNPDATTACPPPDPSNPGTLPLKPNLSCIGTAWTREERVNFDLGKYQTYFGDSDRPVNVTAFGGAFASYCDPTEPTPNPIGTDPLTGAENAGPSGNACNRNRGLSGGPSITITSTLEENVGTWIKTDSGWIYVQF